MGLQIGGLDFDSILQVPEEIASTVTGAVEHAMTFGTEITKAATDLGQGNVAGAIGEATQAVTSVAAPSQAPTFPPPASQSAGQQVTPVSTPKVVVGGWRPNVEHGLLVAVQIIGVTLKVGFFLPANIRAELELLEKALRDVYGWLA